MTQDVASELTLLVDSAAERLRTLGAQAVRAKAEPTQWSIQEIVGHLVDSASNNHQRFVRAQETEVLSFPKYEQDHWVRAQAYFRTEWPELVELWRLYNRHLAHVIAHLPEDQLTVECRIGSSGPVALGDLIEDYEVHLKHHLQQIEARHPA